MLAGSFAHLLMALLCFYLIFWPLGVPTYAGRIEKAEKTIEISGKDVKTPAAEIGLKKGDLVTKVDGVRCYEFGRTCRTSSRSGPARRSLSRWKRRRDRELTRRSFSPWTDRGVLGVQHWTSTTLRSRGQPGHRRVALCGVLLGA